SAIAVSRQEFCQGQDRDRLLRLRRPRGARRQGAQGPRLRARLQSRRLQGLGRRRRRGGEGLAHRRGDVAAVDGGDVGGCLERQRLVQEGLRDVGGGDFAAEQIAAHVVLFAQAARLGA